MFVKHLLLVTVIIVCFFFVKCDRCPVGFVRHRSSCYWYSTFKATFPEARSMCQYFGSKLTKITNKEEDVFVRGYAMTRGTVSEYLLGGTDLMVEGRWLWEGDEHAMSFHNWYPGQPDNYGNRENCLVIRRDFNRYKWNDDLCDHPYHFICERRVMKK